MKYLLFPLLLIFATNLAAQSQCPYYQKYMDQGNAELRKGANADFEAAINAFSIALTHCPDSSEVARARILEAFKAIEKLKKEAETAKKQAQGALKKVKAEQEKTKNALAETEKAQTETETALNKAENLVNAFYFYANRFALAYGEKGGVKAFYFIDTTGEEVPKLGRWEKAEQFDGRGFAQIKKKDNGQSFDYLLDTTGRTYRVAYDIKDLSADITALDLSEKQLDSIPAIVFQHTQLQVLLLNSNPITTLPAEIGELKNLAILNLQGSSYGFHNQLTTLPAEIEELKYLTALDLSYNNFTALPAQIGKLKTLTILSLYRNQLTTLPAEIGELKHLTVLNLNSNELTALPAQIGELKNLTALDLGYNRLTALPSEIGELKNLRTLNLARNQLTALPTQIRELKNLTVLNLYRCFSIPEQDKEALRKAMPWCKM